MNRKPIRSKARRISRSEYRRGIHRELVNLRLAFYRLIKQLDLVWSHVLEVQFDRLFDHRLRVFFTVPLSDYVQLQTDGNPLITVRILEDHRMYIAAVHC